MDLFLAGNVIVRLDQPVISLIDVIVEHVKPYTLLK